MWEPEREPHIHTDRICRRTIHYVWLGDLLAICENTIYTYSLATNTNRFFVSRKITRNIYA